MRRTILSTGIADPPKERQQMAKQLRQAGVETANANYHNDYVAKNLQASKSTTKQLDLYSKELGKAILRLAKVLERMPEGMWLEIGEEIRSATNSIAESKNALDIAHSARVYGFGKN